MNHKNRRGMWDIPRDDGGQVGVKLLHMLISNVWRKGVVPEDWRKALIVPLSKKGDQLTLTTTEALACSACLGRSLP